MRSKFGNFILNSPKRIPMPIGVYTGLEMIGGTVKDAVTNSKHQTEAVLALHERMNTQVLLTAMDLSAEAEAFGCEVRMSDDEIPTVIGRKVTNEYEVDQLAIPAVGDKRTSVHLETARNLVRQAQGIPVLGGVIGPFSLAGRLFGVSEAMELSLTDPDLMNKILQKTTQFLSAYLLAFREQGVDGVIMAEPAAGLLSPRGLAQFSSAYIKQITDTVQSESFSIILHNCGAKIVHLPKILEAGAEIFHFGSLMDMEQAFQQVGIEIILAGNLDPVSVFHNGTPESVSNQTMELMKISSGYRNFIISSGCDIPPHTSVFNLDAFYKTVDSFKN